MSKLQLAHAIVDKLRTDTGAGSLVTLTGHGTIHKIARDEPPVKDRLPFLGVSIPTSVVLLQTGDVTKLQKATVQFRCYANTEPAAELIADRVETLLHSSDDNTSYYDFSNSNVSTRQVRFKTRMGSDFDEKADVWTGIVEASVIWLSSPCPSV